MRPVRKYPYNSSLWVTLYQHKWGMAAFNHMEQSLLRNGGTTNLGWWAWVYHESVWPEGEARVVEHIREYPESKHDMIEVYLEYLESSRCAGAKERILKELSNG